jgi:hypothetical protein
MGWSRELLRPHMSCPNKQTGDKSESIQSLHQTITFTKLAPIKAGNNNTDNTVIQIHLLALKVY